MLYFLNRLIQLFTLNGFLGTDYHLFGVGVIWDLVNGTDPSASTVRFPRVTLCDLSIRHLGAVNLHTVQCVLTINLFNEKIYVFLWFWYAFMAAATVASFVRWLFVVGWRCNRITYVRRHLKV